MRVPAGRHSETAAGRWAQLTLAEQVANVGSEVGRMARRGLSVAPSAEGPRGGMIGASTEMS